MTNREFVEKLKVALSKKTLYVMGCFGAPMTDSMKSRYIKEYAYNSKSARKKLINNASKDTFGFDCVCFIKGILWGWNGNPNDTYGGAKYQSNGVSDDTIKTLFTKRCKETSTDFSKIEVGEFLVNKDYGHCAIYIGEGLAIEATPSFSDGVCVTEVWNINKISSTGREWYAHGKLNVIDYVAEPTEKLEAILIYENANNDKFNKVKSVLEAEGFKVRYVVEGG